MSVDTSRAGKLRGNITITGPTSKAVIPVDAEITPAQEPPPPASASSVATAKPGTASAPSLRLRPWLDAAAAPRTLTAVALLLAVILSAVIGGIIAQQTYINSGPLIGHTGSVFSVAFSPDGKTLATVSYDHTARLWDITSHHQIRIR